VSVERRELKLGEVLDLVRSIENHCAKLRRARSPGARSTIAEREAVVRELRQQVNMLIVTASRPRQH